MSNIEQNQPIEDITGDQWEKATWPRFSEIPEPRMVVLCSGNGSGTKVFQSFLDGHPEIYMVPAYPLMYLYPHWRQWELELKNDWNWSRIINQFCIQHASVIDSRRIPWLGGMTELGENQKEYIAIDEKLFRSFLGHLLEDQQILARNFILAIHYAYAFCRGEDLKQKKALVFHAHVTHYADSYLKYDFPDMLALAFTRDPRANFKGRHVSNTKADFYKLNYTDAVIFQRQAFIFSMYYFLDGLDDLKEFDIENVRVVRHEDMAYNLEGVMRSTAHFIGIEYHSCMESITFGGHAWWSSSVYGMEPINTVNPRVISDSWRKTIDPVDWYLYEGLLYNYMKKYAYEPNKYLINNFKARLLLFLCILLPSPIERETFYEYLSPSYYKKFLHACWNEATGKTVLKDYTFNAYYRHKWTHKHLNLWKPRWFVTLLTRALRRLKAQPNSMTARIRLIAAQCIYITVNNFRYLWTTVQYPRFILKRWKISFSAFRRMIKRSNYLPKTLS